MQLIMEVMLTPEFLSLRVWIADIICWINTDRVSIENLNLYFDYFPHGTNKKQQQTKKQVINEV